MAFGGKARLRGSKFALPIGATKGFEGAAPNHLQEVVSAQRWLLLPEQAAAMISVSENVLFQLGAGVWIPQPTLPLEKRGQFLTEQGAFDCLVILPLLVALRAWKLCKDHFRDGTVAPFEHPFPRPGQPLFDASSFLVFRGFAFFSPADPMEAAMLAQVVEHARPFVRVESSVQPFDAQLPRRS